MTTDLRRCQLKLLMESLSSSIHLAIFSPQTAPNITFAPNYLSLTGDGAALVVYDYYVEELNYAQAKVLENVM